MGAYKYIKESLQNAYKQRSETYRSRVIQWRKEPSVKKVEKPTNIPRARTLGYKAKKGYVIARAKIHKGRRTRRKPRKGRKSKNNYIFVQPGISHKNMAEQKVNRKYPNMEVLNSYWVGEDGNYKYYEVILADYSKATVENTAVKRRGRAYRGITSAGHSRTGNGGAKPNKKLRKKKRIRRQSSPEKK